jgi:hypothetical protein
MSARPHRPGTGQATIPSTTLRMLLRRLRSHFAHQPGNDISNRGRFTVEVAPHRSVKLARARRPIMFSRVTPDRLSGDPEPAGNVGIGAPHVWRRQMIVNSIASLVSQYVGGPVGVPEFGTAYRMVYAGAGELRAFDPCSSASRGSSRSWPLPVCPLASPLPSQRRRARDRFGTTWFEHGTHPRNQVSSPHPSRGRAPSGRPPRRGPCRARSRRAT